MYSLGLYYENEHNYEEMRIYYLMAIKCGLNVPIDKLKQYISIFSLFQNYQIYDVCQKIYKKLEIRHDLFIIKNKINVFKKNELCPICLETKLCIPIECTHYYCIECYCKILNIKKCAICCTVLK